MAMGIVSDSDFEAELAKSQSNNSPTHSKTTIEPPSITGEIVDVNRGRGVGNTNVPDGLRKIIGEESVINGRQSAIELASQFGISASSVSAYDAGATSTSSYNERPNKPFLDESRLRVQKRARNKLMQSLAALTTDKLDGAKARDLAGIARDMSAVIKNMEPDSTGPNGQINNGPTFIIYSPQQKKEESYPVIHVSE